MAETPWQALDPDAAGLPEARLVLHHAVQLVAAVGQSLGPREPDDSQQALRLAGPRAWTGAAVGGGLRAWLDPLTLELSLRDAGSRPLGSLPLGGRTLGEGLAFLAPLLAQQGQPGGMLAFPRHPPDFPRHPLGDGARFTAGDEGAREQLARLFAGTRELLAELAGPAAPVLLWPHHFDLGCSLPLGPLTLGLGVSPGDGPAGRPYWYATPWPHPPLDALPPLDGGGRWHREGWVGAELPLEALARDGTAQRAQVAAFFRSARAAVEEPG
jgi:hypothetical protein